jgi:hypothetical protein
VICPDSHELRLVMAMVYLTVIKYWKSHQVLSKRQLSDRIQHLDLRSVDELVRDRLHPVTVHLCSLHHELLLGTLLGLPSVSLIQSAK